MQKSKIKICFFALCATTVILLLLGLVLTAKSITGDEQKTFEQGSLLGMIPDGFYRGTVDFPQKSWLGKKFNRAENTGVNVLRIEKYPFTTRIEKGAHDKNLDVLVLDYNLPENPWWLRRIRDEIVEVAPGQYLGKVHYCIIPGFPFTVAFFRLEK